MARTNVLKTVSRFLFRPLERMIRRNVDRRLRELGYPDSHWSPASMSLQTERELLRIESLRRKLYPADENKSPPE